MAYDYHTQRTFLYGGIHPQWGWTTFDESIWEWANNSQWIERGMNQPRPMKLARPLGIRRPQSAGRAGGLNLKNRLPARRNLLAPVARSRHRGGQLVNGVGVKG